MTTTGLTFGWVVAVRRITVVFALFAALGGGVVAVPQPAQAAAPVIATTSTINADAVNPVVSVTTTSVFANNPGFDVNVGTTRLASFRVIRVSDTQVDIAFVGTTQGGQITIKAWDSAFDPGAGSDSNILTITVSGIATVSAITTGVVNPVVSITTPQVFANPLTGGDFTINVGSTGLTAGTVTRVSDTEATIAFAGTAQLGAVTIQARTTAFNPAGTTDSNTVTVTVRDPFTTTWTTTSDGESITLPLYDGGSYNFTVDWGDGQSGTVTTWNDPARTHTYTTAGTYTVTISGTIVGWSFNDDGDRNKIVGISKWGQFNPGNGEGAFRGCENLDITATDAPDLTGVGSLKEMFDGARSLTNPNFSNWNTASVRDMENMFRGATLFNGDVTAWNVSGVQLMNSMFEGATSFNQPLNNWNTSNVENMSYMFRFATAFNQPLNNWNTSNVTDMRNMFEGATAFNENIGTWNTSSVTEMSEMFQGATAFNKPLNSWTPAPNLFAMFRDATAFNQPLNMWDTSNVTRMRRMFVGATAFNQPLDNWNLGLVTNMEDMLQDASAMSVANWSATLQGWAQNPPTPSSAARGNLRAEGLFYSADAQAAHDLLIEAGLSNLGSMVAAIAPSAPTITSATPGNGTAAVAFTAPTSDGGSAITDYEYRLDGGEWVSVGSTLSPFTITGLTNGTPYQVELRAVNGVGPGPVSAPVTVTPAAPATTVPATTAPATTAPVTTAPVTTAPVTTVPPSPTVPPTLPETGDSSGLVAVWAFVLLVVGVGLFGARRRALTGHVDERNSRFTSG